jgi:hypothetical protein
MQWILVAWCDKGATDASVTANDERKSKAAEMQR